VKVVEPEGLMEEVIKEGIPNFVEQEALVVKEIEDAKDNSSKNPHS